MRGGAAAANSTLEADISRNVPKIVHLDEAVSLVLLMRRTVLSSTLGERHPSRL